MARVYLDASFVSACVTDRTDPKSIYLRETSVEWWTTQRGFHELFISQEVIDELSNPRFRRTSQALALIHETLLLSIDEQVGNIARLLVHERVMPGPAVGDAIHVAVSMAHHCEYLLSWNVRHLANPNKVAHLQAVSSRVGLVAPKIVTPDFLWED